MQEYGIAKDDAEILNTNVDISRYYEELVKMTKEPVLTTNFFLSEFLRRLKDSESEIGNEKFSMEQFVYLLRQLAEKKINNNIAKKIFRKMFEEGTDPEEYIKSEGLVQVQDEGLIAGIVAEVVNRNPQSIEDIKNGRDRAFGFLVGQVMKESKGKANPQMVNELLKKEIEKHM